MLPNILLSPARIIKIWLLTCSKKFFTLRSFHCQLLISHFSQPPICCCLGICISSCGFFSLISIRVFTIFWTLALSLMWLCELGSSPKLQSLIILVKLTSNDFGSLSFKVEDSACFCLVSFSFIFQREEQKNLLGCL